jgi:calcium/calmodulin-dependent protein kinase I
MASKSDIDHWQINATVYTDRIEEVHYITDSSRNIRQHPETKVWMIQRYLGSGGFGEVRLEKNIEDGEVRAVKRNMIKGTDMSSDEYRKEIKALLEFSKPKLIQIRIVIWYITNL